MKKQSWLGALENLSLLGLGVGSVATILFKEILYTTTPLSLLMVLGLIDRRRVEDDSRRRDAALAEVDRKLSNRMETVVKHVVSLPTTETIQQMRKGLITKDREVARRLYSEITDLQQELNQRLTPLEQQGLTSARQELNQLGTQYNQLSEAIAQVGLDLQMLEVLTQSNNPQEPIAQLQAKVADLQAHLETLSNQTKPNLTSLQEQISRLDRLFSKLPPPVDLTSMKQEVGELIRMITDLVPRRDLLTLVREVRDLHQQQERLQQSVEAIETAAFHSAQSRQQSTASASPDSVPPDSASPSSVLPSDSFQSSDWVAANAADLASIQADAVNYLSHLRSQLAAVQSFTESLAVQHQDLQTQMDQLPRSLDVTALQGQLQELADRIPAEATLEDFRSRIQAVIQQELTFITEQLQTVAAPNYELVFDLTSPQSYDTTTQEVTVASTLAGSRAILEEALTSTQNRLILILPWSDQYALDEALMQKLEAFLDQGKLLDVGWCHLADRSEEKLLKKMQRGWMSDAIQPSASQPSASQPDPLQTDLFQTVLHQLLHLKRTYPANFQFKILGTSENFLVSDQTFAVLGIADALRTCTPFPELQLKLKTREPEAIQRLINRFDDPVLEADDLVSHWNRGVTRHDLGDKTGAIADYTQILNHSAEDAITYNYRGIAHYDAGNLPDAIADLTQSIALNPQQVAAYCNRGFIRAEQGDPAGAIEDYTQAIQARSDWAIAYLYRGMAWQKLDNHQEAIADYSEATDLTPSSAVARYYRGLAWQKLGNYVGAIVDLEAAATLFAARGSRTNAQKAQKNLIKLRHLLAKQPKVELPPLPASADPSEVTESGAIAPEDKISYQFNR
jgi:tetratricopeptide (TPR) repeat protein